MSESSAEQRYGPTSGLLLGILGLLACVVVLALALSGGLGVVPVRIGIVAVAAAVLVWAYLLRPRIIVEEGGATLLVRNPLVSHRIPLVAVRAVVVKVVTTVRTADARFDAVAVGYSLRSIRRGPAAARPPGRGFLRSPLSAFEPEHPVRSGPMDRDEQVVMTEQILAAAERARRLGLPDSPPTRIIAVPELVLLGVLALCFAATFFL